MLTINSVMKPLIIIALVAVFVTGCGAFPQKYDPSEYDRWVSMLVMTERLNAKCETASKPTIVMSTEILQIQSRTAEVHATYTPNNEDVAAAAKIIANDFNEMLDFYRTNDHNPVYCGRKTALIEKKIEAMVEVIPTKARK